MRLFRRSSQQSATLSTRRAGTLWLTGCATVVDTRVEQLIAAELPRFVGAAARYVVTVDGARETGEIFDIRRVRIVGERVERAGSPVLERIDVTMMDLVVDRKEKRLQSLGTADAKALWLPADIAAFLDTRPGLDNVQVALFPPSEITVETQFAIGGFALPRSTGARIRGRLIASDGRLIMEIIDLRVAGFPVNTIPSIVAEKLMNPLVDLSAMATKARITSVQVMPDAVLLNVSRSLMADRSTTEF
ncbi:MAG: LmeA family phospholipid-binding protein [Burkholderiaceae bacterium]